MKLDNYIAITEALCTAKAMTEVLKNSVDGEVIKTIIPSLEKAKLALDDEFTIALEGE